MTRAVDARWIRPSRLLVAVAVLAALSPAARAADAPACAPADHAGGDWPSINGDLRNTRSQDDETTIGVAEAATLEPAWTFSVADVGGTGSFQSTPVVADGCVYVAGGTGLGGPTGAVYALNADTGELVWQTPTNGSPLGLSVHDGLVYAVPNGATEPGSPSGLAEPAGAHAVALDGATGAPVWASERLDDPAAPSSGTLMHASPVVYDAPIKARERRGRDRTRPLVFVPMSGGSGPGARVPLYFLDGRTGTTVKQMYALSDAEYAEGYGGVGVWTTSAVDTDTHHLYLGSADSEGYDKQHPYNNALVKIDGNPSRSSFATVVAAYQGTSEHYGTEAVVPYEDSPTCPGGIGGQNLPRVDNSASTDCGEIDIDFGASPNLFTGTDGELYVSAIQKSGVFHVARASDMAGAWSQPLAPPSFVGNAATAAVVDGTLYATANPSTVFQLDGASGAPGWVSTSGANAVPFEPITAANGVLYTITHPGSLVVLDAATGTLLSMQPLVANPGQTCIGLGAGVAVARNTVYAPCDGGGVFGLAASGPGALIAFRPAA